MSDAGAVVLLTARDDLRAPVLRLAALAGVDVQVVTGSGAVRAVWRSAAVVLVGADLAGAVAAAGLTRRGDVVVVDTGEPDPALWRSTVELGGAQLLVMPREEHKLVELMTDALEGSPERATTIAVVGGSGGVGASTFAAALAITSAREEPTVLIDGDRFGGGLDVLLGEEHRPGARWPDLADTRGRLGTAVLGEGLPQTGGLSVLSWDRTGSVEGSAKAVAAVIDAAQRCYRSVVVDLPRRAEPAAAVLAAEADLTVLVVSAAVRGTAAAAVLAASLLVDCPQLRLVVTDPGAGRLSAAEVANALCLPVLATLRSEPTVAAAADRGEPPLRRPRGSLHDACRAVLAAVGELQ